MRAVPDADVRQQDDGQQRRQREPGDAALSERYDDERRQQRPHGRPGTAAHLEQRLGEAVAPAGRHPRHPRRLGMEHRRADADQRGRRQDGRIGTGNRQQQQPGQRAAHADGQRERQRPAVGHHADHRLQHGSRHLERQGDEADLDEIEPVRTLQDRVERGQQRLVGVVEQVAHAQRDQDGEVRVARACAAQGDSGGGDGVLRCKWARRRTSSPDGRACPRTGGRRPPIGEHSARQAMRRRAG